MFRSMPSEVATPLTNWVLPTPKSPWSARIRGKRRVRERCVVRMVWASVNVSLTEEEVKVGGGR